jgi:hypothetical protein
MAKMIIENICTLVIAEGLAENEGDFCERWLCRGSSYMRTLRFRQLQPSVEALTTCADKLGYYAEVFAASDRPDTRASAANLHVLERECRGAVERAARERWQGYAQL